MENSWLFPAVEVLHLIGMALYLGPIFLSDLSVLGALPQMPACISRPALALVLLTGAFLFAADTNRYAHNPAFLLKIGLLLAVSLVRTRGLRSLALWSLVILTSRAVIDFDA